MKMNFPLISIEFNRDDISVQTHPTKVPDQEWRYVDGHGHGHFWSQDGFPTLEWKVTGKQWVGDEYDGDEYDVGEWRCRLCEEVIEPGLRLEYGPTHIPGPTWITVTIEGESFVLSPDTYARSIEAWAEWLRKKR